MNSCLERGLTASWAVWSAKRRCKRLISVAGFQRPSDGLLFCGLALPSLLATLRLDHRASYSRSCLPKISSASAEGHLPGLVAQLPGNHWGRVSDTASRLSSSA